MPNETGQSREPLSGESDASVQNLDLGRRIYARYGGSPGLITMGLGAKVARQVLHFADRLPMLDSLHQRWSRGEAASHGLLNLQWLSDFASAHPHRTAVSIAHRVNRISAVHATPESGTVGATQHTSAFATFPAAAGPGTISATQDSIASEVKIHSPSATMATPIARSANDSKANQIATSAASQTGTTTRNQTATPSANVPGSPRHDLATIAASETASPASEISASEAAGSPVDASPNRSRCESIGSIATVHSVPLPSERAVIPLLRSDHKRIHSQVENTRTPILRDHQKAGNGAVRRSTISEFSHHVSSNPSTSGAGNGHEQGKTASDSGASGRGVDLRMGAASHDPSATEVPRTAEVPKEAQGAQPGSVVGKGDASHQLHAEGHQPTNEIGQLSGASAAGPVHAVPTYVGRAIYRRSPGAAPSADISHSPEGPHDSQEIPARTDLSQAPRPQATLPESTSPGVLHAADGSQSKIARHIAEMQIPTRPASSGLQLAGQAREQFSESENRVDASPVYRSRQTGDSDVQRSGKKEQTEAGLALPGALPSESKRGLQTAPTSEKSIDHLAGDRPVGRVMRTVSSRPVAGSAGPGATASKPSPPEIVDGETAGVVTTHRTPVCSLGESATPVSNLAIQQSLGSASTVFSHDSASHPVQRLDDARSVHQTEPATNSRAGRIEVQPVAPHEAVAQHQRVAPDQAAPLVPLEPLMNQGVVRMGNGDEPTGRQNVIHRSPQATSIGKSTTQAPRSSSDTSAMSPAEIVPLRTADSLAIPPEGGSGNFVAPGLGTPVLRSVENEPSMAAGQAGLQMKSALEHTTLGSKTAGSQGIVGKFHSTVSESERFAGAPASVTRQFLLPGGPPVLGSANAVPRLPRTVALSPSTSSSRSFRGFDAATGPLRSSAFTHRSVRAIDTLQRSPDFALALPSPPIKTGVAPHLLWRSTSGGAGAPVPSLPAASSSTATSATGGNLHGWKNSEIKQLANRVYDLLVRRLASERQRRGQ